MPYGYYEDAHYFEGTLAYNFGETFDKFALNISWSTMFAGGDKFVLGEDPTDNNKFSTYVNLSYPVSLPADITLTPALGFTPWKYVQRQSRCDGCSIKASKDIQVTDKFAIPVFVQALVAPVHDRTYPFGWFLAWASDSIRSFLRVPHGAREFSLLYIKASMDIDLFLCLDIT